MKLLAFTAYLALVGGTAVLGQGAVAQQLAGDAYCQHLLDEIAIREQSEVSLGRLLAGTDFVLMRCNISTSFSDPYTRDECLKKPNAQGFWADYEAQAIYVIYPRTFIEQYAQEQNASSAALQRVFSTSDEVESKIRLGGVVGDLTAEIASWKAEFDRACAGYSPVPEPAPNNGNGCLLGICP